jgi:hypothetical protein
LFPTKEGSARERKRKRVVLRHHVLYERDKRREKFIRSHAQGHQSVLTVTERGRGEGRGILLEKIDSIQGR